MEKLSGLLNNLAVSQTLAMTKKSRELKEQGIDVINLSIGEPDFNTPQFIKEAAKKAVDDNFSHYTPVSGYIELRKAICRKLKRENNLDYTPDQIVVSCGAKHSIANVIMCIVDDGQEVIIPAPYWVSYIEIVKLARANSVIIKAPIEQDFKITPAQLEAAITPNTRAFLFSSPSNPTGNLYSKDELKALADVFAKHPNIYIISDEIYEHINFTGKHESIAQFDSIRNNVIIINGVSKGYAMTGYRIGYIAAAKWIAAACDKLQGQITSGVSSIAQKAAEAAIDGGYEEAMNMKDIFRKRRDLIISLLKEVPGIKTNMPQGAFYVFPEVSSFFGKSDGKTVINNSDDLCLYLLNEAHVALVSGDAFGDPNCIRFSYATSEKQIVESVKRIKTALAKLK